MIVKCLTCTKYFDDVFRDTGCPHNTFNANDGKNNFKHYTESWLANHSPRKGNTNLSGGHTLKPEYDIYQEWLNKNRIRI